jgi:hypothetical protein
MPRARKNQYIKVVSMAAGTVGTSTSILAVDRSNQRKSFYAVGLFWVFYFTGGNMVYCTSSDGYSWSATTVIRSCSQAGDFSVYFDGTFLHYSCNDGVTALQYRRGTPKTDGTIDWSAAEQAVIGGASYYTPFVIVDSAGYPWIAYSNNFVSKSSTNDGTWVTDAGFPYTLIVSGDDYSTSLVPLATQKVLAVYAFSGSKVRAQCWNGTSWNAEVTTVNFVEDGWLHSLAYQDDDNVHLVFTRIPDDNIFYTKYVYSTNNFAAEVPVAAARIDSSPVLSIEHTTNILYCFWAGYPTTNHLYFKRYVGGVWDSDSTDRESDAVSDYSVTGYDQGYNHYIGICYMSGPGPSTYNVRFDYLDANAPASNVFVQMR